MNKNYPFSEVREKLASSQKVTVALPQNPRYDQVASALGLSLALKQTGKDVSVLCSSPMTVEFNNLVGVDKISQKIKGTDLVVTFDYSMDDVEKISYNDDGGKLNLVVQPKQGAPAINEKAVNFSYAGVTNDLLFTVGVRSLNQLDILGLSRTNPENIINIDNRPDNTNFAMINILDIDSSSLSEIILGLVEGLSLTLDVDTAQNLLSGIWQTTQGLKRLDLGADAYEAVASCLRAGAVKPQSAPLPRPAEQFTPRAKVVPAQDNTRIAVPENTVQPKNPPADWFEPKIYRSTNNS